MNKSLQSSHQDKEAASSRRGSASHLNEQHARAILSALVVRLEDPEVEAALERLARQLHTLNRDGQGKLSHDVLVKLVAVLDRDGDGILSRTELMYGLREHGVKMSEEQLVLAMYAFDADNDGSVDANEFIVAMTAYTDLVKLKRMADMMKGIGTLKTAPVPDLCVGMLALCTTSLPTPKMSSQEFPLALASCVACPPAFMTRPRVCACPETCILTRL
jgi:Ca2+-binding EF-hand superfamily protein